MQATESVAARLAAGNLDGVDRLLTFDQIGAWSYVGGLQGIPAEVKSLDGLNVVMVGYLLPFSVDPVEDLIVESLMQMHARGAPPTNRMVRVVMTPPPGVHLFGGPVMVAGKFRVRESITDGYCNDIFQIDAWHVEALWDGSRLPNR